MKFDKFVKLSAIEKMAKPMKELHEDDEINEESDKESSKEYNETKEYTCPKCKHEWSE